MATVKIDERALQYLKIRAELKRMEQEYEEKIAPYQKMYDKLGSYLLNHLNRMGAESVRTIHGTVYKKSYPSAKIEDKEAFWDYVVQTKQWELVDKRANATACADHATEKGSLPPGVKYTNLIKGSVRKSP